MANQLWKPLLSLCKLLETHQNEVEFLSWSVDGEVEINKLKSGNDRILVSLAGDLPPHSESEPVLILSNFTSFQVKQQGFLSLDQIDFLRNYLPYCFLPVYARRKGRAISIAHFAQSLDGKIATNSGDSKWIGNEENLIHAHRMRALCTGILVGRKTVVVDKPSLTVRLVEGANPQKIVICSSPCDLSSLHEGQNERLIVLGSNKAEAVAKVDYTQMPLENGKINCQQILEKLFEKGIFSVYIEGGSITTSNFLIDKAVDILQLHLSPLVFGSGRSGIVLPEIDLVEQCIQFENFSYLPTGNSIMFVGELNS